LSMIIGALLAVCAVSRATTGGTFALWNSTATVSVPSVQAGSLTITVNDAATANLDMSLTKLAPGVSLYAPVTVKNTGTLPVSLRVGETTASS
ncbi:TasA family protein, partial [Rhizobium johnstonii]|uniref:TasA family protein n=1 Tax=Rhizobium johnstonii TaxID=3019933 RepID=UPI003F99C2E2